MENFSKIYDIIVSKGTKENWIKVNELFKKTENDESFFQLFDTCLSLLNSDLAHVRLRAFIFIVKISKWDESNRTDENINTILKYLNDIKPAFVRVAISYLPELIKNKPNLLQNIFEQIKNTDYSKYKDSMSSIIKNDLAQFMSLYK